MNNLIVAALTGALMAGAYLFAPATGNSTGNPRYRLATVDQGSIVAVVNATGTINPITTVIVGSPVRSWLD